MVFALALAVKLLPPFGKVAQIGQAAYQHFDFDAVAVEDVAHGGVHQGGVVGEGVFFDADAAHVASALQQAVGVESGHGDWQQAYGGEHREAAADIVGNDIGGVPLVDCDVVQGAFAGIGDGHNALGGFGLAILLFQMGLDDAESHGRFGGGARLGDDGYAVIFMVQEG